MAEEFELDLDLTEEPNINRAEQRIKDLSSKARTFASERDEANAKAQAEAEARQAAEKERDFYEKFSDTATKFPGASEHKDAIKEKVLAGYSVEDATVSVLNAEGKLPASPASAPEPPPSAIGGSATTPPIQGPSTSVDTMSRDEKRAKLIEADGRGELAEALRNF